MARNKSGIFPILLLAALIAFAFVIYKRMNTPGSDSNRATEPPPAHDQARRGDEGRLDQHPRRNRRNNHREQTLTSCQALGTSCTSVYFNSWEEPVNGSCTVRTSHGYGIPDPHCTPGGVNPSVSATVLKSEDWRTRRVRNCQTSESEKHIAYAWYGIRKPKPNSGDHQVCELDHLIPLELGGADGLGNIWPECGPDATALHNRYFKVKDRVENYLADQVKSGRVRLNEAQHGIASDWTQYLPAANRYCEAGGRC